MEYALTLGFSLGFLQWRSLRKSQLPFQLIHGLHSTSEGAAKDNLSLRCNFYHPESGLVSEGVFYNSIMGINYILAFLKTKDDLFLQHAIRLKKSMLKYLFDEERSLFYARKKTGFWQEFIPRKTAFAKKMEQFYGQAKTSKKKLNSNCVAFIFLHALGQIQPQEFEPSFFVNFYSAILEFKGDKYFRSVIDEPGADLHDPRAMDQAFVGFVARIMQDRETEKFVTNLLRADFGFDGEEFKSYSNMTTADGPRRSQCWHDVWTSIFLNSDPNLLYNRYITDSGYLRAAICLDGSNPKKHCFTGDQALFQLLTKLQPGAKVNFDEKFSELLRVARKENNIMGELNPKFNGSIWATGDTIFSLLCQDVELFQRLFPQAST